MATTRDIYYSPDHQLVGQMLNTRTHNVTTAQRTTLAGTLNAAHMGLHVFDTDLSLTLHWNGTAFVSGVAAITGAMVYQGSITSLTTAPASPQVGYTYVYTGAAGTLSWAGQTFSPVADVTSGDMLVYRAANTWDVIEGNDVEATAAVMGNVFLASSAEAIAGVQASHAVTPATLASYASSKQLARTYYVNAVTLVANTPFTVAHNLNLSNKDSFTIRTSNSAGSEVAVDVDSVDVNSLTLTSSIAATGVKVAVIGF